MQPVLPDGGLAVFHEGVLGQQLLGDEALLAAGALVRPLARVEARVDFEHRGLGELEPAHGADARVVDHLGRVGRRAGAKVVRAQPRLLLARRARLALGAVLPQQVHLEALVVFVRHLRHETFRALFVRDDAIEAVYLADGAGVGAVLVVVEHVLAQGRLALEARVANVAQRVGAQVRLEHVEADDAADAAEAAAVDGLLAGGDQVRDEVAVRFELLAALEARVHAEAVDAAQVLHHLLDRQVADVAQVARVRLVQRLDAKGVHLAARVHVDVLVGLLARHVLHVDGADFAQQPLVRVLAQAAQQMQVVRHLSVASPKQTPSF